MPGIAAELVGGAVTFLDWYLKRAAVKREAADNEARIDEIAVMRVRNIVLETQARLLGDPDKALQVRAKKKTLKIGPA